MSEKKTLDIEIDFSNFKREDLCRWVSELIEINLNMDMSFNIVLEAIDTKWKKTTPPKEIVEAVKQAKELMGVEGE